MWRTCLAALQHVGSSRTRARTRVPCTGRQILNHCATREVPAGRFLTTAPPGKPRPPIHINDGPLCARAEPGPRLQSGGGGQDPTHGISEGRCVTHTREGDVTAEGENCGQGSSHRVVRRGLLKEVSRTRDPSMGKMGAGKGPGGSPPAGNTWRDCKVSKTPACPRTGWGLGRSLLLAVSWVGTWSIPSAARRHWAALRRVA